MNLYLDDDSAKASLVNLLKKAGHQVTTPANIGLAGVSDPRHLMYVLQNRLVLLTRNHDDFEDLHFLLHAGGGRHSGVLVVRLDNDPSRDMKDREIAKAIANLERAQVPAANEFWPVLTL